MTLDAGRSVPRIIVDAILTAMAGQLREEHETRNRVMQWERVEEEEESLVLNCWLGRSPMKIGPDREFSTGGGRGDNFLVLNFASLFPNCCSNSLFS